MINNTMSRRGLLGLIGAGALAVAVPAVAEASVTLPTMTRWNRTTVHLVNQLGSAWPVASAATKWADPSKLDLVTISKINYNYSMILVRFGRLPVGILGQASCERDGRGEFKRAYITINDRISKSYPYSLKLLLLRHEIGHAVGFAHTRTRDVMNQIIDKNGIPLLGSYHMESLRKTYGR